MQTRFATGYGSLLPAFAPECRETRRIAFALDCGGLATIMDVEGPEAIALVLVPADHFVATRNATSLAATLAG